MILIQPESHWNLILLLKNPSYDIPDNNAFEGLFDIGENERVLHDFCMNFGWESMTEYS